MWKGKHDAIFTCKSKRNLQIWRPGGKWTPRLSSTEVPVRRMFCHCDIAIDIARCNFAPRRSLEFHVVASDPTITKVSLVARVIGLASTGG